MRIYSKLSEIYNKIYKNWFYKDYTKFISHFVNQYGFCNPSFLDLGCGTGLLIKSLVYCFPKSQIDGIDSSLEMLQIAKRLNKKSRFYHQSFTFFNLGTTYDVIVCTFDSINYLTKRRDIISFLKNVKRYLKENGLFIFDFNTKFKNKSPINLTQNIGDYLIKYKTSFRKNIWNINIYITHNNETYLEKHRERLYSLSEMNSLLKISGLKIFRVLSSLKIKAKHNPKSDRLFLVCTKRKS